MSDNAERCQIHDDRDPTGVCSCSYIVAALRQRLAEIDSTLCRFRWHAGILTPLGPPPPTDGARCYFKSGHDGHCSFVIEAQRRGWKVPDHLSGLRLPTPTPQPPRQPYSCNVPMCGESGVCEECRKRGAR